MGDNTATITFNYNNNNPQWTVSPDSLPVPQGSQNVIWKLSSSSSSGTKFVKNSQNQGGIVFKPSSNWPGTTPTYQNDTRYTASETNNNPGPGKQKYNYTINVLYTPPGGSERTFSFDPDVTNEPPTGPGPFPGGSAGGSGGGGGQQGGGGGQQGGGGGQQGGGQQGGGNPPQNP